MTYIPLELVISSMINAIGYDQKTHTLRVEFNNKVAYDYPMFTDRDWSAFQEATSKGKHFYRVIKPMFGHRTVKENELKKPCCDHPDQNTCDDSCSPCDEGCCSRPGLSHESLAKAITQGRALGAGLLEQARKEPTGDLAPVAIDTAEVVESEDDEGELPALVCSACNAVYSPAAYETGQACGREGCIDGTLG